MFHGTSVAASLAFTVSDTNLYEHAEAGEVADLLLLIGSASRDPQWPPLKFGIQGRFRKIFAWSESHLKGSQAMRFASGKLRI